VRISAVAALDLSRIIRFRLADGNVRILRRVNRFLDRRRCGLGGITEDGFNCSEHLQTSTY
jgi:hypothetical protein